MDSSEEELGPCERCGKNPACSLVCQLCIDCHRSMGLIELTEVWQAVPEKLRSVVVKLLSDGAAQFASPNDPAFQQKMQDMQGLPERVAVMVEAMGTAADILNVLGEYGLPRLDAQAQKIGQEELAKLFAEIRAMAAKGRKDGAV